MPACEPTGKGLIRGDLTLTPGEEVGADGAIVLDVRGDDEVACKPIPGEIHIPLNPLCERLTGLPRGRTIQICCAMGARPDTASRLLNQHGYTATSLSGGAGTWFCVDACNQRKD